MNDRKEALWFAVVSGIGMLFIIILIESSEAVAAYAETQAGSIPGSYWALVCIFLSLCALVPYLLYNSKPMDFRISAIVLTAIVPAATVVFITLKLWSVMHG